MTTVLKVTFEQSLQRRVLQSLEPAAAAATLAPLHSVTAAAVAPLKSGVTTPVNLLLTLNPQVQGLQTEVIMKD